MADKTGPDPSNRQVQRNVNRNTNQQVQSIRKLVQGVPPGVQGPKDPAGNYNKNIATNNTTTQKQTSQQKNQQKQQIGIFQLLANSVTRIEQMLSDLFTKQRENKTEQDKQIKVLNDNVEKLTKQFSTDLNKKLEKPLSSLIDTLNTLNKNLSSNDPVKVTLTDDTITALNTKLSTTLAPTLKDIDLTPLISGKIKEIDLNKPLSEKLSSTTINLSSIINEKVKEVDLNKTLNEKIKFDASELTKTIKSQVSTLFSNVELSTIIDKNIKPIKLDVSNKIDADALNQSLSKTFSKIKFSTINLTDAISDKIKEMTLDLNKKIKVKDVTINITKKDKGQKSGTDSKVDLKSLTTILTNTNKSLSSLDKKLQDLIPNLPKGDQGKKEKGEKGPSVIGLIDTHTDKSSKDITKALSGISNKIEKIDSSLNNVFNKKDKNNKLDIINSTLESFQKDIKEAVKKIAEKVDQAVSNYFNKEDSKFYKNFKNVFDESLNKKIESMTIPTSEGKDEQQGSGKIDYIWSDGITNSDATISSGVQSFGEGEQEEADKKLEKGKSFTIADYTYNQPSSTKDTTPKKYRYKNTELEKLAVLVQTIKNNTDQINNKLNDEKFRKIVVDPNLILKEPSKEFTDRKTITQQGEDFNLRSNVSDIFKSLGRNLKNKIKNNKYVDFQKFASNFKKPIKIQNKIQDTKSKTFTVDNLVDKKPNLTLNPTKGSGILSVISGLFSKKKDKQKQPYSLENYLTSYGKYSSLQELISGKVGKGLKSLGNSISELNLNAGEGKSFSVDGMKDLMDGKSLNVSRITEQLTGKGSIDISQITNSLGDLKNLKNIGNVTKNIGKIGKTAANIGKVGSVVGSIGAAAGTALVAGVAAAGVHGAKNAGKWNNEIGNTNGESVTGSQAVDGAFASINHYFGEGLGSRVATAWKTGKWSKLWGANNQLDNEYTEAEHMALMSMGKDKADQLKLKRQTEVLQKRLDEFNKGSIYNEYGQRMSVQNSIITRNIDRAVGTQDSTLVGNTVSLEHLNTQQLSNLSQNTQKRGALIKFQSLTNTKAAADLTGEDFVKKMGEQAKDASEEDKKQYNIIHNTLVKNARYNKDTFHGLPLALQHAILTKAGMDGQLGVQKINYLESLPEEELENGIAKMDSDRAVLLKRDDSYEKSIMTVLDKARIKYKPSDIHNYKKDILSPLNLQMLKHFRNQLDFKKQIRQNNMQQNIANATKANKEQEEKERVQKEQLSGGNINIEIPSVSSQTASASLSETVRSNNNSTQTTPERVIPLSSKPTFNPTLPQNQQQNPSVGQVNIHFSEPSRTITSQSA